MRTWLLILLTVFLVRPAIGGTSGLYSYLYYSRDGTKVLVMRSPTPANDRDFQLPDGTRINISERYAKSGVYDAVTHAPLWQVDWYSLEYALIHSADLEHVVRLNIHGLRSDWTLEFYKNGKLLRTYDCRHLLTGMRHPYFVPFSTWDWHSQWYCDWSLSPDQTKLLLSTARRQLYLYGLEIDLGLQEFYVFDLATGDMLSQRVERRWVVWVYAVTLLVLGFVLIIFLYARYTKRVRRWH